MHQLHDLFDGHKKERKKKGFPQPKEENKLELVFRAFSSWSFCYRLPFSSKLQLSFFLPLFDFCFYGFMEIDAKAKALMQSLMNTIIEYENESYGSFGFPKREHIIYIYIWLLIKLISFFF